MVPESHWIVRFWRSVPQSPSSLEIVAEELANIAPRNSGRPFRNDTKSSLGVSPVPVARRRTSVRISGRHVRDLFSTESLGHLPSAGEALPAKDWHPHPLGEDEVLERWRAQTTCRGCLLSSGTSGEARSCCVARGCVSSSCVTQNALPQSRLGRPKIRQSCLNGCHGLKMSRLDGSCWCSVPQHRRAIGCAQSFLNSRNNMHFAMTRA